jgi:hypothetical protein
MEARSHREGGPREVAGNAATQTQTTTVERITVALVPKAVEGLQRLMASTGLSKTDVVNRAITLYEFVDSHQQAGDELLIRDARSGDLEIIHLL